MCLEKQPEISYGMIFLEQVDHMFDNNWTKIHEQFKLSRVSGGVD